MPMIVNAQDQLRHRHARAAEIEVVGPEQAQEEPQQKGRQDGLSVGLEQHHGAGVAREARLLLARRPRTSR